MSGWSPLRLEPVLKYRLWGGTRLQEQWGKPALDAGPCGESWELTWRPPDDVSRIRGGPFDGRTLEELAARDRAALVGSRLAGLPRFPLLAKLLDCSQRLSVQVHPSAAYVATHPEAEPKIEAWVVLDAPDGAELIFGVRPEVDREAFGAAVTAGRLADMLERRPVRRGDVLLVEPGTVHALLEGLMVYEIQQNSDTTFRVYDWDRTDAAGARRELHVEQALECIAFGRRPPPMVAPLRLDDSRELLVATPAFALERLRVDGEWTGALDGSRCEILTVIEGEGMMSGVEGPVRPGDSFFVPAAGGAYLLDGWMSVLRAYLPAWPGEVWEPARAAGYDDAAIRAVCGSAEVDP